MIVHEATRTGAPRVGGLIAQALQRHCAVQIIALRDGEMAGWLKDKVGSENFKIVDRGKTRFRSFESRVALAKQTLEQSNCELVYVNSLASSEYLVAAHLVGKKAVLHLHEKTLEIHSLLRQHLTKLNIVSFTPAMILAGGELANEFLEIFGALPPVVLDWGIAIDADEVLRRSKEQGVFISNVFGRTWKPSDRLCVGMVGHASQRKGTDIMIDLAERLPHVDFHWIGVWELKKRVLAKRQLGNFYFSGGVDNPYKYMAQFDLLFLTSREDPNPLVIAEAMMLSVPVFCFSRSTAVTDSLARQAVMLHGSAEVDFADRLIGRLDRDSLRAADIAPPIEKIRSRFDINVKIGAIVNLLQSL
jgi:glycosyltransferase involved in cell wall biosynthesis